MQVEQLDALAKEVQAGRTEAFDSIVVKTIPLIRSAIRFLIADDDLADDVVQETYIQLFQEIGRYTPGTNFLAWAKTLARTQALSARSRRGREQAASGRYQMAILERIENVLEEQPVDPVEAQVQGLRKCMDSLKEKARTLVELRYFKRLSLEEVADALGVKAGSVAVSLHRIRAILLKCLEVNGVRT